MNWYCSEHSSLFCPNNVRRGQECRFYIGMGFVLELVQVHTIKRIYLYVCMF